MYDSFIRHLEEHKKIKNGKIVYGTSLDRIDSSKGYELSNCRWTTNRQQELNKNNKKQFVAISLKTGKKYVFADNTAFCKANGFNRQRVSNICNSKKDTIYTHKGFTFRYAKSEEMLTGIKDIENVIIIDESQVI